MKEIRRIVLSLILLFVLSASVCAQDLVILHTNDTHSQAEPFTSGRNIGFAGVQRRANYIQKIKAEHSNVLLLDAGDYNQGTPYFTLFKGDMEVMLYNAIGYDAVCLGNHEFDNGQAELARRLSKANYTTLCANYDFGNSPIKQYVKPYTIIEKNGKKIGIIGLLIDLNGYVAGKAREGLTYKNPISVANSLAKMLKKKEKCDLVICLTHLGYDDGTKSNPSDLDLAKGSKNVDIIIGGHSHTFLEKPTIVKNKSGKDVIVTQVGAYGVYVGKIDINF